MLIRNKRNLVFGSLMLLVVACTHDILEDLPSTVHQSGSPVVFDPDNVPFATLSDYHFFSGGMDQMIPATGVLPFDVITPLFSDHAKKQRYIWMPDGVHAQYNGDHEVLDFPDNTLLIKTFYYDNVQPTSERRIIETRLLMQVNGEWISAVYVWNDDQTEAYLDMSGIMTPITWVDEDNVERSTIYRIPSGDECYTCHKQFGEAIPIGPKPQNLDKVTDYPEGPMGQLERWVQEGYLASGYPANIEKTVAWDDPSEDMTKRVRSYLDMNCAHCHADGRHCDYRPMRFAYELTADPVNLGVCVEPDDAILPFEALIITSGDTTRSILHYRLASTEVTTRMPLLGRTLVHEEGLRLVADWITSLSPPCN